jgi:hypothetical protein
LVEAVYRGEVSELADRAAVLLAENAPDIALTEWMRAQVRFVSHRRGLAATLKATLSPTSDTMSWSKHVLLGSAEELLEAAQRAGTVRTDLEPYDLLRLGHGIAVATELGSESDAERLIEVMLSGLRTAAR